MTAALILAFLLPLTVHGQDVGGEVIYGDDDRIDLYEVKDTRILQLAESTVVLFKDYNISMDNTTGRANLDTRQYGESMSLCAEEPFFEQPTGGFCSGSLVGPDLLMTAGHCITSQWSCDSTKFVFGFSIFEEGVYPQSVPAEDVYGCAKLVARVQEYSGADWALIRLDRPVKNRKPLSINRSGKISDGLPLFVIGHPSALPTKVAGGANVRDSSPKGHFVANLDTYGGNSGSAVFNARNGLIEGILVRGETDYVWQSGCQISNVCSDDGCRGEDVTKISALSSLIPPIESSALSASAEGPAGKDLSRLSSPGERNVFSLVMEILEIGQGKEYQDGLKGIAEPKPAPVQ